MNLSPMFVYLAIWILVILYVFYKLVKRLLKFEIKMYLAFISFLESVIMNTRYRQLLRSDNTCYENISLFYILPNMIGYKHILIN